MKQSAEFTRFSQARTKLVMQHVFFAHLALGLRLVEDPTFSNPAATDGRRLIFNPNMTASWSAAQIMTTVAHEAMHCALEHPMRLGTRDHRLANTAMDYVVNLILTDVGFEPVPKDYWLCDTRFAGMAWEKVYRILWEERQQQRQPGRSGKSGGEGLQDVQPPTAGDQPASPADLEELAERWREKLLQAAQLAQQHGSLPGSMKTLVEEITAPKVDWRAQLREFLRARSAGDYSWRRPNVRHIGSGAYFPALQDESTMGTLELGVDSSGSNWWAMPLVCGELNGILDTVKPERVEVIYVDVKVHHAETFRAGDYPVRIEPHGCGGTHLAPVWGWRDSADNPAPYEPDCAILVTDLELNVSDLGNDPGYPVLILSTAGRDAPMDGPLPFGRLVKIDRDQL